MGTILIFFSIANLKGPFLNFLKNIFLFGMPPSGKIHTLNLSSNFLLAFKNAEYESFILALLTIIEFFLNKVIFQNCLMVIR